MYTKEILTEARKLIEQGWTQGSFARDKDGDIVEATHPTACSWCATGAIQAVVPINIDPLQYYDLLTTLAPYGIVLFNDDTNRTKEDILEVYDEAIARCENDH